VVAWPRRQARKRNRLKAWRRLGLTPAELYRVQLEQPLAAPAQFAFLKDIPAWQGILAAVERSFRDGIPRWYAQMLEEGLDAFDPIQIQMDVSRDYFRHFSTQNWEELWEVFKALYAANATPYPRSLSAEWAFLERNMAEKAHRRKDPSSNYLWNPLREAVAEVIHKHSADLFETSDPDRGSSCSTGLLPVPTGGPHPAPSSITYDCPKGGLDPFDTGGPRTQHFSKPVTGAGAGSPRPRPTHRPTTMHTWVGQHRYRPGQPRPVLC
jgi:hypothetical protein